MHSKLLTSYLPPLLRGERRTCREIVRHALDAGTPALTVVQDVLWPAMERIDRMYRTDEINRAVEHMATRINRHIADQIQAYLPRGEENGRRILIVCADDEPEELGAQMCADLFESQGWDVYFAGGGVPHDEVLGLVGELHPNLLVVFGSKPSDAPKVRELIRLIREVGATPTMNIMVSGGVFNRAEGLWREVQADLFAGSAQEALRMANDAKPRTPELRVPNAPKKRRRRRRPPLLEQTALN